MDSDNPQGEFKAFLQQLQTTATRSLDLPTDQRELYFTLTKKSIFPIFSELGAEVAKRGRPVPLGASSPTFYSHETVDQGKTQAEYLSVSVHTPVLPESFTLGDLVVRNVTSTLYVFDGVNNMSFQTLDTGEVVLTNINQKGSARVLNTSDALFNPIPCHTLYPAGNPAAWINKIIERGMLDKMKTELAVLDVRK